MKKRILIVAGHDITYRGGLEVFIESIATKLSDKYNVSILTLQNNNNNIVEKYKKIIIYRASGLDLLGGTYPLINPLSKGYRLMKKKKFDVVIVNTRFFQPTLIGALYGKRVGAKVITIEHGNTFVQHNSKIVTKLAWLYDQIFGRIVYLLSDKVFCVSKSGVDFTRKLGSRNSEVLHNCVDPIKIDPKSHESFNILFMGRLIYAKGVQHLIQAVKELKMHDITLHIVGSGNYENELKIQADGRYNIIFYGSQPREKIFELLQTTDVFVNASYSEGLPTSALEAGICGVPIILTNVGGSNEIIDDINKGILIEPKNVDQIKSGILKIMQNQDFAKGIGQNVKNHIEKTFTWSKTIDKLEKEIENE